MVTTEMAEGHIDKLLSFQIFFISMAKFHISEFSLPRFWECYVPRELLYQSHVLFYSIDGRCIGSAEIYRCISYDRPVQI